MTMKESTKDAIFNGLYYLLWAIIAIAILCWVFWLGELKGMTEAHKTQLKEQIRLLEQEKQESMTRQILNEKQ